MTTQEFIAELEAYKSSVDTSVRLKTAPNSVRPTDTGGRLRDVADLFEMFLDVVGYTPSSGSALPPVVMAVDGETEIAVPTAFVGGEITLITHNGFVLYPSDVDTREGSVTYTVDDAVTTITFSASLADGILSIYGNQSTGETEDGPLTYSTEYSNDYA